MVAEIHGFGRTDVGNAKRLVLTHGSDIRFCHSRRKWLIYDGQRWIEDDTGEVRRRAKQTVKEMLVEAADEPDDEKRKKIVIWQTQSEFENRLKALISLAELEEGIPVRVADLDREPQLFNCQNGTLDLRSGTLREHLRQDLITKVSPVVYRADSICPRWCEFLSRIMGGDANSISFLQRIVGYSLTGDTREQVLFLLYGWEPTARLHFWKFFATSGAITRCAPSSAALLRVEAQMCVMIWHVLSGLDW